MQLFLTIILNGSYSEAVKNISGKLSPFSTSQIQANGTANANEAHLSLQLDAVNSQVEAIELLILENRALITEINIHFPSTISGVSDPYGASAVSIKMDDDILKIDGVLGVAVSDTGKIKVSLDPGLKNKDATINEILNTISFIRAGNL